MRKKGPERVKGTRVISLDTTLSLVGSRAALQELNTGMVFGKFDNGVILKASMNKGACFQSSTYTLIAPTKDDAGDEQINAVTQGRARILALEPEKKEATCLQLATEKT